MRLTASAAVLAPALLAVVPAQARPRPAAAVAQKGPAPPEKIFPFGVTWVLRSLNDKPVTLGDPPSLSIDSTLRGHGFGGCNGFSMALYPVKNQVLASGAIATTRKMCAPDVMALERTVLVALHSLPRWELTAGDDLVIRAPRVTMVFRRGV